jgi:restriction system protein
MPVPTYDQFIEPLLRFLGSKPEGATASDAYQALADGLGLTADERAQVLPSGFQAVYKNRIGWAHDRLKRAGLSGTPRRGVWKVTPEGHVAALTPAPLTKPELERLTVVERAPRGALVNDEPGASSPELPTGPSSSVSPEERIASALSEIRESVGRSLLEIIGRSPPEAFEHLVLDLLHQMGYGATQADVQRVGGSGDGGIDGIISLDRLGLEKIYIQAKRWKNVVGSPEIQGFMGALQLQGASKGVFITTSSFTREAKAAAAKARGSLVLIDGQGLTALMIEHGVAVTHALHKVPRVDSDYFEDG